MYIYGIYVYTGVDPNTVKVSNTADQPRISSDPNGVNQREGSGASDVI